MNILFTLCGRAGSKGVKGKNAREFCGKPLVWYSMATIALYKELYARGINMSIVLNTDSEQLIDLVQQVLDLEVGILHRSENLAGDKVAKVDVIEDCLNRAEQMYGMKYDIVVDLDITSPLRTAEDVRNAIMRKVQRPEVDVVYSVTYARRNPYFNMVKEVNGFFEKAIPSKFTTRQEAPAFYDMNASIYAYSPDALRTKEHTTFFNSNCDAVVTFDTGILDIDSEEDYDLMQVIAQFLWMNKDGFKDIYNKVKKWK